MAESTDDVRIHHLTESTSTHVDLSAEEADNLRLVGQQLASQKLWWGHDPDADANSAQSVVTCNTLSGSKFEVRIADAVGAIGLGQTLLIVNPKIPLPHLLFLFAESDQLPRQMIDRTQLSVDATFFAVVAAWFVTACETLLRHGLATDYTRVTGDLGCARGRIHTVATSRSVIMCRPVIRCDFDLRSEDTSLNRVLKAAVLRLLSWTGISDELRSRCRRIQFRFGDVGEMQPSDMLIRLDPLTRSYVDVHPLALMILRGSGPSTQGGRNLMWTFLYRTPEAVETGVRASLSRRLKPHWELSKRGLELAGDKKRTLNADLVFGNFSAVGDVKYKCSADGNIARSELYQATTFATGYGVRSAAIVSFGRPSVNQYVQVGRVRVTAFNWNVLEADPGTAADQLADALRAWLKEQDAVIKAGPTADG